jgi:hypothetical protein
MSLLVRIVLNTSSRSGTFTPLLSSSKLTTAPIASIGHLKNTLQSAVTLRPSCSPSSSANLALTYQKKHITIQLWNNFGIKPLTSLLSITCVDFISGDNCIYKGNVILYRISALMPWRNLADWNSITPSSLS